jgi:hypothetical protein
VPESLLQPLLAIFSQSTKRKQHSHSFPLSLCVVVLVAPIHNIEIAFQPELSEERVCLLPVTRVDPQRKRMTSRDMSFSNSDGSITRRQDKELQASKSTSRVEEEIAVQQAEECCVVEGGWKSSTLGRLLGFFYEVIRNPLVNAAVAIFSLGVGVGLMLGDPSRDEELSSADDSNDATGGRSNLRSNRRHQIEELPEHSPAAALLPSQ